MDAVTEIKAHVLKGDRIRVARLTAHRSAPQSKSPPDAVPAEED